MADHPLPDAGVATEWLQAMHLIRRFEERASELYAQGRIGGFLHVSTGEEATIIGSVRALRETDYLVSTYRAHGHTLARGSEPGRVMAELLGRVDGLCRGRAGSTHLFDGARRFMGGYGIVGAHLPLAAGFALAADRLGTQDVTLCQFGDGASNQATFGEALNLAALWSLPVVFMVTNNRFAAADAQDKESSTKDLVKRAKGFGVKALRCDGMDVVQTHDVTAEALAVAREERRPMLVEARTYRFRGHSAADPDEERTAEQLEEWRRRDPLVTFGDRLVKAGILDDERRGWLDRDAIARIDEAVAFAEASPEPDPQTLADDLYAGSGR